MVDAEHGFLLVRLLCTLRKVMVLTRKVSKNAAVSLISWSPMSEKIVSARLYSKHIKLTVIHACAPTNDIDETDKDNFHGALTEAVEKVHRHNMLVITGDFNAKVGSRHTAIQ